jgi:hypothetical protein
VQLAYDTYAAGVEVMQMHAFFSLGPWNYRIDLDYHTTGLVGLLYRGQQVNTVRGAWEGDTAAPAEFSGDGVWRGLRRRTLIDYDHGLPQVRELQPPQETEREPVPADLQRHTMDTLSALVQLLRRVQQDHACETEVRTYDGRRLLDVVARTGGEERLDPTGRSIFSGVAALRLRGPRAGRIPAGRERPRAPPAAARLGLAGAALAPRPTPASSDSIPDPLVRTGHHVPDRGDRAGGIAPHFGA